MFKAGEAITALYLVAIASMTSQVGGVNSGDEIFESIYMIEN